MIPDPSNPQVGDVFIDAVGVEMTIGIVGSFCVAHSWVDEIGDTGISVAARAHVAEHWKPKPVEPPIVTGVEMPNGRQFVVDESDEQARRMFPHAVRIGPARVVFVEDEQ